MCSLDGLFANNCARANQRVAEEPEFDGLLRRLGVSVSAGQAWDERHRLSLQTLN